MNHKKKNSKKKLLFPLNRRRRNILRKKSLDRILIYMKSSLFCSKTQKVGLLQEVHKKKLWINLFFCFHFSSFIHIFLEKGKTLIIYYIVWRSLKYAKRIFYFQLTHIWGKKNVYIKKTQKIEQLVCWLKKLPTLILLIQVFYIYKVKSI